MTSKMFNETINLILKDYYDYIKFYELNDKSMIQEYIDITKHIFLQINENIENIDDLIKDQLIKYRENICLSIKDDIPKNIDIITELKKIKLPAQRTKEWYEFRQNRLTASDMGTVMGSNPYSNRNKLIAKKCGYDEPFFSSPAIKHGIKFEDVAIHIYEKRNNVSVHEYGCIPHPKIPHFGASPDGICDVNSVNKEYIGRMLEIKCPKSRVINEFVPSYYELQVQGQLEVCNLELCDYLECSITEYSTIDEFKEDSLETLDLVFKNNTEKGVILETYHHGKEKTVTFILTILKLMKI